MLGLVRGWGVDPTRPRRGDHGQSAVFSPDFFPHLARSRHGRQNVENHPVEDRVKVAQVSNAAASGDRRRLLVAMRNLIAEKLDEVSISSRDLASLTKRLADISAEIEAIDKASNEHDPAMQALDTEDERLDEHED